MRYINSYYIDDCYLSVIANSDSTGLTEDEEILFNRWFNNMRSEFGNIHIDITDERDEFTKCFITRLYGACTKVKVYVY